MPYQIEDVLSKAQKIVDEELIPLEENYSVHHMDADCIEKLDEIRAKVQAQGLWTPQIEEHFGGVGLSVFDHGLLSEVMGQSPFGHYAFNAQAPDAGNMEVLIEYGTPEQQEKWLKPLVHGKIRSCFSMTEKDFAGSNPVNMGTTAVLEGDEWVVNGHKWYTSSADGASFAIVMCVTDPDAEVPHKRASMILVPADTPGYEVVRNIPVMGDAGIGWGSHSEMRYTNCRVPKENLIGERGAGFKIAQGRLGPGRIHHCMRWLGISKRAFDMMCRRAAEREIATGVPLASKQTIQNWIAESQAEINAARLMVLEAAKKMDAVGTYKARIEISTIKFFCSKILCDVLDRAVQVHGSLGMSDDLVLAQWWRHERASRIYDGPDEAHKSSVARQILKGYGVKV